jgi:hypothetical protein
MRIIKQISGLLICGFGVQVPGGAPVLTWGFIVPGHFFVSQPDSDVGEPQSGEWIPYRTMLLRLTRDADIPGEEEAEATENEEPGKNPRPWYPDFEEQRAITAQFIKPLLYSLRREQVLLMTHAQNSRGLWPFLVNGNLLRDSL